MEFDLEIKKLWEKLYGYNISEVLGFRVEENNINFIYSPTRTEPFTPSYITFNFNINKVINTLNLAVHSQDKKFLYHILNDNSHILLITAFETYLIDIFNMVRKNNC